MRIVDECSGRSVAGSRPDHLEHPRELAAARVPAILIPLPNAVDDHQRANARAAEQSGGAIVLEQDEIKPDDLAKLVRVLMDDPVRLKKMAKAIRVLDASESARHIAGRILERLG